jgi:hypothetical protein
MRACEDRPEFTQRGAAAAPRSARATHQAGQGVARAGQRDVAAATVTSLSCVTADPAVGRPATLPCTTLESLYKLHLAAGRSSRGFLKSDTQCRDAWLQPSGVLSLNWAPGLAVPMKQRSPRMHRWHGGIASGHCAQSHRLRVKMSGRNGPTRDVAVVFEACQQRRGRGVPGCACAGAPIRRIRRERHWPRDARARTCRLSARQPAGRASAK